MDLYKEKIKFPFKCPVCGKEEFENLDWLTKETHDDNVEVYEIDSVTGEKIKIIDPIKIYCVHCSYCGWMYDLKQVIDYNTIGNRNNKTINELKHEYQNKLKENPKYNYDEETSKPVLHKCPICGEYEFKDECSYDICPICGWEDDGTEEANFDDYSDANATNINNAKKAFFNKRKINPKYRWDKD